MIFRKEIGVFLSSFWWMLPLWGEEDETRQGVAFAPEKIISQYSYSDSINGCGPACVLNLLQFGPEAYQQVFHSALIGGSTEVKLRYLVDRFFKGTNSSVYRGRKRWGVQGIAPTDLAAGLNELLAESDSVAKQPALQYDHLDRAREEGDEEFLRRIHEQLRTSLHRKTPPILSLRSYSVKHRTENDGKPAWELERHHMVLVVSVPRKLRPSAQGFEMTVLDPHDADPHQVWVHNESHHQAFRALKGASPEVGVWLDGRPFLLAQAPGLQTLRPRNLEWSDRFHITLNFLIGDWGF